MTLEALVETAASSLGMPGLNFTRDKSCEIIIGGKLLVTIEAAPVEDAVHIYTVLGWAPDAERAAFFAALLKAQLFHAEVGEGCSFGLDEETNEILLNRKLTTEGLQEEDFLSALNEFANWAEYWIKEIENLKTPVIESPGIGAAYFMRA